jgi:hypothetical protein
VINSAKALATGVSLFFANYGYKLVMYKKLWPTTVVLQAAQIEIEKLKGIHA